jgi:hypothetical protein
MAEQTFPQTGDPEDAQSFAQLIGQSHNLDYVEQGYNIQLNGNTVTIGNGVCYVSEESGVAPTDSKELHSLGFVVQTGEKDFDISNVADVAYFFVEPQIKKADDPLVTMYETADPPSERALLIGYVDTNANDTQEKNRHPDGGDEEVHRAGDVMSPPIVDTEADLQTLETPADLGYSNRAAIAYVRSTEAPYTYNPSSGEWDRYAKYPHGDDAHKDEVTRGPDTYVSIQEPSSTESGETWVKSFSQTGQEITKNKTGRQHKFIGGMLHAARDNGLTVFTEDEEPVRSVDLSERDDVRHGDRFERFDYDTETDKYAIATVEFLPDHTVFILDESLSTVEHSIKLAEDSEFLESGAGNNSDSVSDVVAQDGRVFVLATWDVVLAYDIETGSLLWEEPIGPRDSPHTAIATDGDRVFVDNRFGNTQNIDVRDASDGSVLNTVDTPDESKAGSDDQLTVDMEIHRDTLIAVGYIRRVDTTETGWAQTYNISTATERAGKRFAWQHNANNASVSAYRETIYICVPYTYINLYDMDLSKQGTVTEDVGNTSNIEATGHGLYTHDISRTGPKFTVFEDDRDSHQASYISSVDMASDGTVSQYKWNLESYSTTRR